MTSTCPSIPLSRGSGSRTRWSQTYSASNQTRGTGRAIWIVGIGTDQAERVEMIVALTDRHRLPRRGEQVKAVDALHRDLVRALAAEQVEQHAVERSAAMRGAASSRSKVMVIEVACEGGRGA